MKFDDQLAAYLYENKTLKLEGLGTFILNSKVSIPNTQEKEVYYPIEGLSFTFDPKSTTDENIIFFLVKKLGKIEPLIRSDLESYLSNIKQFINIGKPYTIEGVGTLSKNNQGIYEFTPGNFLPAKEELNPHRENAEHNYPVRSSSSAGRVIATILIVVAALAALGGIGWGITHFVSRQETPNEELGQQGQTDTISHLANIEKPAAKIPPAAVVSKPDTTSNTTTKGDSVNYKMIFEITKTRARAERRTLQLQSLHSYTKYDSIRIADSLFYRLYLPLKAKPADTTHLKDSLKIFFGHKIRIEKQK